MTGAACHGLRGDLRPTAREDALTHVELTWIDRRMSNWIRFGHAAQEQAIDRQRRILSFRPGSIFAFLRWAANDYGTILSCIDIVRAVEQGEPYQTLPFVRPGADILLRIEGWPKVEQVLRHIDAIEALDIDLAEVAPDHWRHVHNRMNVGLSPRPYTIGRHQAWLKRREIER
ncbi:DUF2840 domain-containing protein [Labrys sp. 22185]|uniref:DUF2840 domain-containing protein n=1 Tax=Labrys sp. 22185 TaxID=3453888 RepID=UPI003F86902F